MGNIMPSKLAIIFIMLMILSGCAGAKKIAGDRYLLEKNTIFKNNQELSNDPIKFLLVDHPNKKILGIPLKKEIFTPWRDPTPDSVFNKWLYKKEKQKKAPRQLVFPQASKGIG